MKKPKITLKLLAKDVLKYLDPKTRGKIRLRPRINHCYVNVHGVKEHETDLQALAKNGKTCEVCGIAALLVALAIRQDAVTLSHSQGVGPDSYAYCLRHVCEEGLSSVASSDCIDDIESFFEHGGTLPSGEKLPHSAIGRLRSICNAIVAGEIK